MKKWMTATAALALGATLLTTASAAQWEDPIGLWGQVTWTETQGTFALETLDDTYMIHGDQALYLDAVTGQAMDSAEIQDGDTVYAYIGPAMTLSLPPQTTGEVVIGNIPADFGAPTLYAVDAVHGTDLTVEGDMVLVLGDQVEVFAFETEEILTTADLVADSNILVWRDMSGSINRVMMFPLEEKVAVTTDGEGNVSVDGLPIAVAAKLDGETTYLPLRAIAETMGYTVTWNEIDGATVMDGETLLFTGLPDGNVYFETDGISYVEASRLANYLGFTLA